MLKYIKTGRVIAKALLFCWPYILTNIIIVVITTAINILINFVNKDVINQLTIDTVEGKLSKFFIGLILTYAFLYLFQRISGFLGAWGYNFYQLKVDQFFQDVFNWKSYTCEQENFFNSDFLEQYYFARKGITRISSHINDIIHLFFSSVATIVTTAIVFLNYSPFLLLLMVVIAIISFVLNRYIYDKEYMIDKEQIHSQKKHDYYKGILVDKEHAKELRIYKTREFFYSIWYNLREKLRLERLNVSLKKIELNGSFSIFKLFIRILSTIILVVGSLKRQYNVGTFVLLFGFINSFCDRIDSFSRSIVTGTYKDVKYIVDFYDFVYPLTNEDIRKAKGVKKTIGEYGEFKELILKNVSYKYPNSTTNAINNVSLSLKRGEVVSILGYNGSGKTTLSKLMSGCLFPQQGKLLLNGVEITEKNKSQLYSYFGFAPQEFSKFSLSIDEFINLRCCNYVGNKDTKEALSVYEQLSMDNIISKFPNGKETILGKAYSSEGIDLSGGEWQFLNIASSFAGEPEILLLDEPTASIDPVREEQIMRILHNNMGNKTVILISHRLGFARLADRIILMENGEIVEQGSHDTLINYRGTYFNLFSKQKNLYE